MDFHTVDDAVKYTSDYLKGKGDRMPSRVKNSEDFFDFCEEIIEDLKVLQSADLGEEAKCKKKEKSVIGRIEEVGKKMAGDSK